MAENNKVWTSNEAQTDYIEHTHKADPKKPDSTKESTKKNNLFIDWKRPFVEGSDNAMDFESGKEYRVFMSFF